MDARAPFDPANIFDALAERTKCELMDTAITITLLPEYTTSEQQGADTLGAVMAGAMTAVCGLLMSHIADTDDNHLMLRVILAAYLPPAFDNARSIIGRAPLPEAS